MMLNRDTPKRKLSVNLSELESAFESSFETMSHYLDLETGQIVMITEDIHWRLEEIYKEMQGQEGDEPIDFATALEQCDVPDWEKDMLQEADQIEVGYGTRYIHVPEADTQRLSRHGRLYRHCSKRASTRSPVASAQWAGSFSLL